MIGPVIDRFDRRLVMILGDLGAGLTTLGIWLLFLSGNLAVWHVFIATFVNTAFNSFQWTAHSTTTALLIHKQQLGRASGLSTLSDAISMLVSPLLVGVLYVSIGLASALLLAGPLADRVFEPLLTANGPLANSIGLWVGVGAGRGTGFFFMILGLLFAGSSLAGLCYFPLRTADKTIPDSA